MDLSGIAKGFAVDKAVEASLNKYPDVAGFVEAGGDIRFFGDSEKTVQLRLGQPPNVCFRSIRPIGSALATSSPGAAQMYGESKTHFRNSHVKGSTVVAMAERCALADGFTKIGIFATHDALTALAREFHVSILFFDSNGELMERESACESAAG
jgi:thiamine biosynthesis lipoprotein ApbE